MNPQSFGELLQITWFQLLVAILAAILLQIVDPFLCSFYQFVHWKIPDDEDYTTLMATISGIGGVFIGLYYAAISTVGSSIYSRVPNNIRDLLTRERMGNIYMRYLAFLTFISLCIISLRVLGLPRIVIAVPLIILMAGIGIIAFVKLGQRVFGFFNPVSLSNAIFNDMQQYLRRVTAGGFRWNDPLFQNHAYKQARQAVDTLKTLAGITSREAKLNVKPFVVLTQHILLLIVDYQKSKKRIPSESRWYEQRYLHHDWYLTEDSTVSLAHQTGTTLQPNVSNDKQWVENNLFPVVFDCLKSNLKYKRYVLAMSLLEYVNVYLTTLAKENELVLATNYLQQVSDVIFDLIIEPKEDHVLDDEVIEYLALAEWIALMPINILISCSQSMEKFDKKETSSRLNQINWNKASHLYTKGFNAYVLPQLEWLKPRLNFEIKTQGRIVSPLWYITELTIQAKAEKFAENAKVVFDDIAKLYDTWFDRMDTAKRPWLAAAILSRELEYWNKIDFHFGIITKTWNELEDGRHIQELPWPKLDLKQFKQSVERRRETLLKKMAKHTIILALFSRQDKFPDFGGQFLHTIGEAIFEGMISNNDRVIKTVFATFFLGCWNKFERLKPNNFSIDDWRTKQEFKIAAAPLMDLLELSGYSFLLSEFHHNPAIWSEVRDVWNKYLEDDKEEQKILFISAIIGLTEIDFEIPHHGIIRSNWAIKLKSLFAGIDKKEIVHIRPFRSDTKVFHDSPLVRMFAKDQLGPFCDGLDIFITIYLKKRTKKKDLDFGRKRTDDLEDALRREEKNYSEHLVSDFWSEEE